MSKDIIIVAIDHRGGGDSQFFVHTIA